METTLADSDRQIPNCTQTLNKLDIVWITQLRAGVETSSLILILVSKCSRTHVCLSRIKKGIVTPWDRQVLFHSSTAVVQLAVNQLVGGSIPSCGASFRIVTANFKLNFWLSSDKSYPVVFSRCGEMVSSVLWEHVAQVRFLHRRPVIAG